MNVIYFSLLLQLYYAAVAKETNRDVVAEKLKNTILSYEKENTTSSSFLSWYKPPEPVEFALTTQAPASRTTDYETCDYNSYCVTRLQCNNTKGINILRPKSIEFKPCANASLICCKVVRVTAPPPVRVTDPPPVPVTEPTSVPVTEPPPVSGFAHVLPPVPPHVPKRSARPRKVGCGWRNERGIARSLGGEEALFGEFPWTIAVFGDDDDYGERYQCTGSLIHYKVVLSTGIYFIHKKNWFVRAGEYDLFQDDNEEYQTSKVEDAIVHPSFHSGKMIYNIALLFLEKEVILESKPHIGFACLPAHTQVPSHDTLCIVTGWGSDDQNDDRPSNVMKMVKLPIVERSACQQALQTVGNPRLTLDVTVICAGGRSGQDTCRGDGGAPLVCPEPGTRGRYYQAGIVSWGRYCGREGIPGVYTNVAELRPWIDEQMISKNYSTQTYTPSL